jgi:Tfp pilus assembly protein PilF/TolB-like protein
LFGSPQPDVKIHLTVTVYNRRTLQYFYLRILQCIAAAVAAACFLAAPAAGQALPGTQTLMVMPFENQSSAPGLEWISESFPEVLSQRMASARMFVMSRDDRDYAFDHSGVPSSVLPSRATIYRVAEQMDADYVVMGSYTYDGRTFRAQAQLLDMKKLHLSPTVDSSGPLASLIDLQTALAWQLLQQLPTRPSMTREQFMAAFPPIRLNAFENYIRGILATSSQQKVHYFHDAVKLDPNYNLAMLQLGKTYFDSHEYESASSWFMRVPKTSPLAGEANFLLGMSEFYRGNFDKSYAAFSFLATRVPLTEVFNNLGVVEARRGHRGPAVEYFTKAVTADPKDADYRFNLAIALYKNGDSTGAGRQLKDELQQRPNDNEAKTLLDLINRGVAPPPPPSPNTVGGNALLSANQPHLPMERIKRNYDEASYRQLEMEIHNINEARLAKMDVHAHASYHVQRGKELMAQNMPDQAEVEFRDAIAADYNNDVAHAQLAMVLEKKDDISNARAEAQTSVRLKPNVDGLLVLARLDLKQNQMQQASNEVDRALGLEPANSAALALKRDIAAKQTGSK